MQFLLGYGAVCVGPNTNYRIVFLFLFQQNKTRVEEPNFVKWLDHTTLIVYIIDGAELDYNHNS